MQLVGGQKYTLLSKNILYLLINEQRNFVKSSTFFKTQKDVLKIMNNRKHPAFHPV